MKELLKCIVGALLVGFVVYSVQSKGQNVDGVIDVLSNIVWEIVSGISKIFLMTLSFFAVLLFSIMMPILALLSDFVSWINDSNMQIPLLSSVLVVMICMSCKMRNINKMQSASVDKIVEDLKSDDDIKNQYKYTLDDVVDKKKLNSYLIKNSGMKKERYKIFLDNFKEIGIFSVVHFTLVLICIMLLGLALGKTIIEIDYINSFGVFSDFIISSLSIAINVLLDIESMGSLLVASLYIASIYFAVILVKMTELKKNTDCFQERHSNDRIIEIMKD